MDGRSLPDPAQVLDRARAAGFDAAGIAPVSVPEHEEPLRAWLAAGHHGGMEWMTRNTEVRVDLRTRFSWARSAIVVLRSYRVDPGRSGLARFVSSYAQGVDYHDVLLERLHDLEAALRADDPGLRSHAYVDTGPVLERQLAEAAGLGWTANNTLLLHPQHGSRFFLGVLITDLPLEPTPAKSGSCGTCRACQPACPTGAFVRPGVLDARRCISYLTIEHRGPIPRALRPAMGQWLFGCDLCQTCCPFEIGASDAGDPAFEGSEALLEVSLSSLLRLDDAEFRARFRRTPLWRPRRRGLLRNALIVAANGEHFDCVPAAVDLLGDAEPVLREAASWMLATLGVEDARPAIATARGCEDEEWVVAGMDEDLGRLGVR